MMAGSPVRNLSDMFSELNSYDSGMLDTVSWPDGWKKLPGGLDWAEIGGALDFTNQRRNDHRAARWGSGRPATRHASGSLGD